jgi:hypothetical protein
MAGGLVLTAGTLAAGAGVAAHASGTSAARNVRRTLGYACGFPAGTQQLGVTIAATFPAAAIPAGRIQPTKVVITVRLPAATVADLRKDGATAVTSTASLSVKAGQRTTTATRWEGQTAAAESLAAAGGLSVIAPGQAAPVTVTSGKTVTFTAAGLTLALQFGGPSTASPSPSSPATGSPSPGPANTAPAALDVTCVPASHSDTTLAAVPVEAASAQTKSPEASPKPKLPKDCGNIKVIKSGAAVCGYITGYSDVKKLYGAALLQPKRGLPALVNIDFGYRHVFERGGKLIAYSTGELYYRGHRELPPVRPTFLAFGFVPVTASLQVTEVRPISIKSVSGITAPPYPITVTATTTVAIRISDVVVNGVPLAIGPHCRPVSTARLTLTGHGDNTIPPRGYTVPTGGPLSGLLTIPAFTGCGVTENLDPLLTGSISGSGNYVLQTQGKLCGPSQPQNWTCPPPVPKPIR